MPEMLSTTVDKFTFRVPTDRMYSAEHLWVLPLPGRDPMRVRVGMSDYLQQRTGDMAFADVEPAGTRVALGEEFGSVETIKVNLSLACPVAGVIVEINPSLETAPEVVNQDPYGEGWLAVLEVPDPEGWKAGLLAPEAYLTQVMTQAEAEVSAP